MIDTHFGGCLICLKEDINMALVKNLALDTGIECPSAYIKVGEVSLSFMQKVAQISIYTYKDAIARQQNKSPLSREDIVIANNNVHPAIHSEYKLYIQPVQEGNGDQFVLSYTGNVQPDIVLTEGIDFIADGTVVTPISDICDALNNAINFKKDWEASVIPQGISYALSIKARPEGACNAEKGNDLIMGGSMIGMRTLVTVGEKEVRPLFDDFFNIETLSMTDNNVISQAYEYLKTLPNFSTCQDV